jgi:hypothetical protein
VGVKQTVEFAAQDAEFDNSRLLGKTLYIFKFHRYIFDFYTV